MRIIYCGECKKSFKIEDDAIFDEIEEKAKELTSILHKAGVPVSYKSHEHVSPIVYSLIRCCVKPEIYITAPENFNAPDMCKNMREEFIKEMIKIKKEFYGKIPDKCIIESFNKDLRIRIRRELKAHHKGLKSPELKCENSKKFDCYYDIIQRVELEITEDEINKLNKKEESTTAP